MCLQRLDALPLLDHREGVRAKFRLEFQRGHGIDGGFVFDASPFRSHCGNVGMEGLEDGVALASLGGDYGDDVDHGGGLHWESFIDLGKKRQ